MEQSPMQHAELPWSAQLILRLRHDLNALFFANESINAQSIDHFIGWLITSGRKEYAIIEQDTALQQYLLSPSDYEGISRLQYMTYLARPDVQQAYPLKTHPAEFIAWFYRHAIIEHQLWSWLSDDEQTWLRQQAYWQDLSDTDKQALKQTTTQPINSKPNSIQQDGVNLIGYVYGQLGIGEDLRMAARACKTVDIPFALFNFPPGNDIPQNDRSMAAYVTEDLPYNINIFCMTALEHGRFYVEKGENPLANRYNIGYWPWGFSQ